MRTSPCLTRTRRSRSGCSASPRTAWRFNLRARRVTCPRLRFPRGASQDIRDVRATDARYGDGHVHVGHGEGSLLLNARGIGVNSPYQVQPLIGVRLPTGVPYVWRLDVHNPHATPLRIVEAVSGGSVHPSRTADGGEYRGDDPRDNATAALDPSIVSNPIERASTGIKETNAASDWIGERARGDRREAFERFLDLLGSSRPERRAPCS